MARRIPSLNWLRVFEAAARTGSFARAAERLAMSRPAVSQQIRALEAHLGCPLFERAPAGVTLTETGRRLLSVVGESLGRMEAVAAAIASPTAPPLVIGVSMTLSVGWLAPRLPSFQSANPNVSIKLHSMVSSPETPPRDTELWIGFGTPPPGTEATYLFGETLVPVAHPALADQIDSAEDVLEHLLIEVSDHRRNWAQILGSESLPQNARVLQVDTTLTAMAIAAAEGGVALARPPASNDLVEKLGLVACLTGKEVRGIENYYLLHAAGSQLSPAAEAFKAWVQVEARLT